MPKGDREILKADPEDGTTPIANLLLEALAIARLSGKEKGIILYLWRRTYGWEKDGKTVSKLLSGLVKRNILKREFAGPGKGYTYSMNTRVGEWDKGCINHQLLKELSIQPLSKSSTHGLSKNTTPPDTNSRLLNKDKEILKKESVHTPKLSSNPSIARMQRFLGFPEKTAIDPVPNPGKEAMFIKKMLKRGFTEEQIFKCWEAKVDDRSEFVSMVWVNEDIGKKGGGAKSRLSTTKELKEGWKQK